jgi:hypothetical protein
MATRAPDRCNAATQHAAFQLSHYYRTATHPCDAATHRITAAAANHTISLFITMGEYLWSL